MKKIYISENAFPEVKDSFKYDGWTVVEIKAQPHINTGISAHPDIYMCKLGVYDESPVFFGDPDRLRSEYPGDVLYNAACSGKYFVYHKDYTDPALVRAALNAGAVPVRVRQGYAKCSTAIIDEESFITSDEGIAKALKAAGASVLLIRPGHIDLPGYDYGFIGGTCGRVEGDIVFNGDISAHPDFEPIKTFISSRELNLVYFEDRPLTDIGSIIPEI